MWRTAACAGQTNQIGWGKEAAQGNLVDELDGKSLPQTEQGHHAHLARHEQ